jgi:hypothetical protein
VSAVASRSFTTAECARRWHVRQPTARSFLRHFARKGFVRRVATNTWVVTPLGLQVARTLDEIAHDVAEAA